MVLGCSVMDLGFVPTVLSRSILRCGNLPRTGIFFGAPVREAASSVRLGRRSRTAVQASADISSLRGTRRVITTPLYYVNAAPHMGSAYPTIAADALSRFYRMAGAEPFFVTGCDEHGEKVAAAAAVKVGNSPCTAPEIQQFCDGVAGQFEDLWDKLAIRYDRFVRTSSPRHAVVVKQFMERVWANGDIYKSVYEGLYCTGCEEYKDEKDLLEGHVCPSHQKPCSNRKEENYFFALSKYQEKLQDFLEQNPDFVLPRERRNEVLGWVKSGVRDFSVSRANNPWGIPVPRDDTQTIYVWFDALLGYVTALLEHSDIPDLDTALSRGWPADVHIIGKDILRFHAVYWPAMLMSAGVPLPTKVIGHGFITKDGMKMGKSLGNTLDPVNLVETYGSDAVRYYFLKAVDFGKDGDFSEQRFVEIVNADLANSLGNLVSRSLNLLKKNCGGIVPISAFELGLADADDEERELRQAAGIASEKAFRYYGNLDFMGASEAVMRISHIANLYIDRVAPWKKFKSDDAAEVEHAKRCIVSVLEGSRIVAAGLSPIVPSVSQKIYEALGLGDEYAQGLQWEQAMEWGQLCVGTVLEKPKPVFPRLEVAVQEAVAVS